MAADKKKNFLAAGGSHGMEVTVPSTVSKTTVLGLFMFELLQSGFHVRTFEFGLFCGPRFFPKSGDRIEIGEGIRTGNCGFGRIGRNLCQDHKESSFFSFFDLVVETIL